MAQAFDTAWEVVKATRALGEGQTCQHCGKSERHPEKGYCIPCFEESRQRHRHSSKDSRKQSDVDDRYHGTECHCAACMSEPPTGD